MPASVPTPLDMPMRMEAHLGAMSRWLTLKPEMAKPEKPTASVKHVMAVPVDRVKAVPNRKVASKPKPPQLKILRTIVVDKYPRGRKGGGDRGNGYVNE